MAGELESAFSQIDLSLNRKEDRYRELDVLKQWSNDVDKKHAENMQSIAMYSAYEDQVNQFSQKLLRHDQEKIRQLHAKKKETLKELIQNNGGSYAEFMRNGGMQHLVNYKNELINSEESQRYVKNAENLARIIQARDSGKAGLLSRTDIENLQNYENNGGGEITYSGLLSPIDMPPPSTYALGDDIPAEDILKYKNNANAIRANYMREFPELGVPTNRELVAYARKKYEGKGSNQALLYSKRNKGVARSKMKDDKSIYTVMSAAKKGLNSMNDRGDKYGFKIGDDLDKIYQNGRSTNRTIFSNDQFTSVSETVKSGLFNDVDETRPYKAYEFNALSRSLGTASKQLYADNYNKEENKYFFNTGDFHGASGVKMNTNDTIGMRPKTVILAPTGRGINPLSDDKNEDDFFAVEFADSKGKIRTKPTERYMEEIKDTEMSYVPWEVWEGDDGNLYYKKVDLENVSYSQAYRDAIGNQNDITEEIIAQKQIQRKVYDAQAKQELNNQNNNNYVKNFHRSPEYNYNLKQNFINKNNFKANEDIFSTMVMAFSGATGEINSRTINQSINTLNNIIPMKTYNLLQNKETTLEQAYISLISELKANEDDESGIDQIDKFASYWKGTYEFLTNKKLNVK